MVPILIPIKQIKHKINRNDLSGRKIAKPQKGINIIRMNDSSTRKVMIK